MKKNRLIGSCLVLILVGFLLFLNWKFAWINLSNIRALITNPKPENIASAANPSMTGINNVSLVDGKEGAYKFFALGHIYGNPLEPKDTLPIPAKTFLAYLPQMKKISPDMLFLLGDIVPVGQERDYKNLEKNFLSKVQFPVFNAVGNHDVEDRDLYESLYGVTYYSFTYASDLFLVLDSEELPCRIPSGQYEMIRESLSNALSDEEIKNIFIMMHRVLFIDNEEFVGDYGLDHSLVKPNTWLCYEENDYREILSDLILPAAEVKPVYWFGGDVGAFDGNLSPYYQKYPGSNLTFIADGIGDSETDVITLVSVSETSEVSITFISLNETEMLQAENYDLEYWLSLEKTK